MYFREEKARLERKKIAEQTKGIGKPKVGGPFKLVDHNGKEFTDKDMRDKYALVRLVDWHITHKRGRIDNNYRYTLVSHIALTSVLTNWIRWPT